MGKLELCYDYFYFFIIALSLEIRLLSFETIERHLNFYFK